MDIEHIIERIESIDWYAYSGSPWYRPDEVAPILRRLANLQEDSETYSDSMSHFVLSTIGNDHAGTYYPAIQAALDILINITAQKENKLARSVALAILYDLTCFQADLEGYTEITAENLESWVDEKLKPYNLDDD